MKSKKIFVLLSALALLLGACNAGGGSKSQQQSSSNSAQSDTSSSQGGGQEDVAVTAITLNKNELSLEATKSETLTWTVTPNNASDTSVTFESDHPEFATVSALGKVTGVAVGNATITVKSVSNPEVTATCAVTVTEEGGKYGSLNKPKTVAEALAIAADECKEKDTKTGDAVYIKGFVSKAPSYNAEKGFSKNIYLKDALTDSADKEIWVYSANHDVLKIPYQNDQVILHGYIMNYNGTIELTNVKVEGKDVYPEVDAVTRGTSSISYVIEHGSVNPEAPTSGKNNSEFSFSVTPENGYKVDRVAIAGEAVTADATSGLYKGIIKGNTTVNIDISREGLEVKTVDMAYPKTDADSTNMVEGNNAATVGLDASVFEVVSTNSTGLYAGLNKAGEIRLYDNRKAEDQTQIANGTTLTVSSRKVTITKINVELTSASTGTLEVKSGDQVVTGNEGTYQIDNNVFSLQNVSRIEGGASAAGKQVIISKVTIFYTENTAVAATAIAVTPKTLTLKPEQSGVLSAALTPANATDTVVWETSDPNKATVDQTGRVTAVAEGTATITAKVSDTIKDAATVTIEAAEVLNYGTAEAPLSITEAKALLAKLNGEMSKQPLFVTGVIGYNAAFSTQYHNGETWLQSEDGATAKDFELWSCEIDASCNYSGDPAENELVGYEVVATGYGKLYNTTYELTNNSVDGVRVNPKIISMTREEVVATAIAVAPTTAEVETEKTVDLTATVTPANSTQKVAWKSSDETKATVANGKVRGVAAGPVTITAFVDADKDGVLDEGELKADCAVTVKQGTVATEAVYSLKKLNTTNTSYGTMYDVEFEDGKQWKFPGNQSLDNGLKVGGKPATGDETKSIVRNFYSKSVYASVGSIIISHGAKDSAITVNSVKLYVFDSASDAAGNDLTKATETVVGVYADSGDTSFAPAAGGKWANKYFKVVYDMTTSAASSNKGVMLEQLKLVF